MIRLDEVTVVLGGRPVLESITLAVEPGTILLVVGANGAGKSVLARAAAGLLPLSSGIAKVGGVDVRKAPRQIGYLPQDGGLYEYLTVAENLDFMASVAGVSRTQRRRVCTDLLELTGLAGLAEVSAARLTPGQRQRLALARTLAGDPPVLIFDEPLAGLDAAGRADARHLLADMAGLGKALLITAGDPDGLAANDCLTLSGGRLKGGVPA
jgi:ABC-type multidrug transport system ATPase subunit